MFFLDYPSSENSSAGNRWTAFFFLQRQIGLAIIFSTPIAGITAPPPPGGTVLREGADF
jgi:hypothetical protein